MTSSYAAQLGLPRRGRKKLLTLLLIVGAVGIWAIVRFAAPTDGGASTDPESLRRPAPASSSLKLSADYGHPQLIALLRASWLPESSGITRSSFAGRLWTHNDSGDEARVYCLTEGADRCGSWNVAGAKAIDWESISVGPGPVTELSYLFVGDIGDNSSDRDHVTIYRFAEPSREGGGTTEAAHAIDLRYPDGSHDAEAMFVHPETGAIYIITKEPSGGAGVYAFKGAAESGMNRLEKVGTVSAPGVSSVTAADIAPDGTRVILGTYGTAFEFQVPARSQSFDAVWKKKPSAVSIGLRLQGEAVAYSSDGESLFSTSEMTPTPLYKTAQRD